MVDIVVPPVNFVFNVDACAIFPPLVVGLGLIDIHVFYSWLNFHGAWIMDMGLGTELIASVV